MQNKFYKLKNYLKELDKQGICLAFSGGVDSLALLYLCKDLNIIALTLSSCFQTKDEINFTKDFCKKNKINHKVIKYNPLNSNNIKNNPKDRCYHCKKIMFEKITNFANENNFKYIIDGTNYDDINTYRPGLKALEEFKIISPFKNFKITKKEIRNYLENINKKYSQKPSSPCLATRFPYGANLDCNQIAIVEKLENFLKSKGFLNNRIRLHDNIARIEIPNEDFNKFIKFKDLFIYEFKKYGITYITLDIEGLRTGSMDI